MLINMDVKSLEVCVAEDMAKDKIMIQEITERQDMHKNNQDALGLPSRLIAKVFIFRLLFGGSAYSYANDLDFAEVGYSEKQWQEVIDSFYKKYSSIASWHKRIIESRS
jgi:DNA polymerase I-like protein with 3'-5' exonuclease and polymerase domains